jgi:hypothetical protein
VTIEQAIEYGTSKGFVVRQMLGGLQILADPFYEESIQATMYRNGALVFFDKQKWHIAMTLTFEQTYDTFEEVLTVVERCFTDKEFFSQLWEQEKAKFLKEQHDPTA